jgi:hypothetical protein
VKLAHTARMMCLNAHLSDISKACDGLLELPVPAGCTYAEVRELPTFNHPPSNHLSL